jgi:hypothetical protein
MKGDELARGAKSEQYLRAVANICASSHRVPSREGLGDYVRKIGRMAVRLTLSLGFLLCLTLVGAAGAGAQTGSGSGSGACGGSGSGATPCVTETTTNIVAGSTTTPGSGLALTGEQAAIPLAAAAGLMIVVLGARQLRRRANN